MNLIAAILPLPRKLREPVKKLVPAFFQGDAGTSGLGSAILAGAKSTTGKCFSFFPLVPACKQASGSVFQAFSLSPVLSFVPVAHANNRAWSSQHDAQRIPAPSASGA